MTGLILPEIVYNVKKKLGCIFIENHNSEPLKLKRGQTIGLVTSCVVTQAEQGQLSEKRKENTQSVTGHSNDSDTRIGGTSGGNAEKAGRKAGSIQSKEDRQLYKTKGEKHQFICECFQLDMNAILDVDTKLKEAVIKLFLDNFKVLAMHPSQYGETEVLEMKIDLVPGAIPYKSRVRLLNPDQKENLQDQIDKWLQQGVIKPSVSPWVSPLYTLEE